MAEDQRKLRNMLIAPLVQGRIISHVAIVLTVGTVALLAYVNGTWNSTLDTVFSLPQIPEEARTALMSDLAMFFKVVAVILVVQFIAVSVLLILHTHRFLGAGFAITRYVKDHLLAGNYDGQLRLRKGDYLVELATEVNQLGEKLAKEEILQNSPH